MTPDVCMQFLVWSYYYHDILPQRGVSYQSYGKFSFQDAKRLDDLKAVLFKSFEERSVFNACQQFRLAKENNEPCPYTQSALDQMFAKEQ